MMFQVITLQSVVVVQTQLLQKMLAAITSGSTYTSCLSYNNSGLSDVYLRYGASAIIGTSTPIQAYSVSGSGISTWDTQGVNTSGSFVGTDINMTWDQANTACSTAGARLPTAEELYTLSQASHTASGNTSFTPPSFGPGGYWSSTTVPSTPANAYIVYVPTGGINSGFNKTGNGLVRCVR
jgi:hypothetical protein